MIDRSVAYRALSIQSHMVSGYCGNKAAVFPLQILGFDVDVLNTVQFSNHTGYPSWTGNRLADTDVQELFDGLEKNGLIDDYTHILTGYIGNYAILDTIKRFVLKLKSVNPNLIYVCDPVMGDWGRLYVAPEIVPLYRNILQVANVVTPNQFEAEILADIKIDSLVTAKEAAKKLHFLGVSNVIITTLKVPFKDVPSEIRLPTATDESLYCLTSQTDPQTGSPRQHLIVFPTYRGYFSGTGDMFTALVVARWQEELKKSSPSLAAATKLVVMSVNAVTRRTWENQVKHVKKLTNGEVEYLDGKPSTPALVRCCELQMVQSKLEIEKPEMVGETAIKMTQL
ncbi:Ribokinase-like protein [Zychaea mexicana]|uniref:Ribokinase-like protein n=1 Tax=Zychaea mexicana TaxID=64656 RepID=UPI0022FEB4DA|nr:Ribokinase-like protein [Zychaea mexicana]KAI9493094.1 Ribokinase-like protein [Zychaea mexicana]